MDSITLAKHAKRLDSRFSFRRKGAVRALAADNSKKRVPSLVQALSDPDSSIAAIAEDALRGFNHPDRLLGDDCDAVNAFCAVWAEGRDARLGRIVTECGYVASRPVALKVLTALKCGQSAEAVQRPEQVEHVVAALTDKDGDVARQAEVALRQIKADDVVDAFCRMWAQGRDAHQGRIVTECGYVASLPVALRVLTALKCGQSAEAVQRPEQVEHVVAALTDKDGEVAGHAEAALRQIKADDVVDAFCRIWAQGRDARLGKILRDCGYVVSWGGSSQKKLQEATRMGYVAPQHAALQVLTALKCRQAPRIEFAESAEALAQAADDQDKDIAATASKVIAGLRDAVAVDALIEATIQAPRSALVRACVNAGFRHTHDETHCVYLLVTEQLDAYFGKYFDDFQHVRRAYEEGDKALRANIMRVVQSGDLRFQEFFRRGQQRHERGEEDILMEVDSSLRLQDWPQLFELFLEAPMKYGYPLLDAFRQSGWEPPEAAADADAQTKSRLDARRSLYAEALRLSEGKAVQGGPSRGVANSASVVQPITVDAGGQGGKSVSALVEELDKATPIEGIPIVAALAGHGNVDEATRQKVQTSPHWPVRLAGRLTGLCPDSAFTDDPVHWVREGIPLVTATSTALELWPSRATPEDVQRMNALPPKAFEGKLGAVRSVLRLLITSGVKSAIIEQDQAMARQQAAVVDEEE
jgi:hypothetical protein